ncbi:MAG TPA: 5'-nucleotidase [Longimicrobiales bacterium]
MGRQNDNTRKYPPRAAARMRPLACIGALALGIAAACTPAGPRPGGAGRPERGAPGTPEHPAADTLPRAMEAVAAREERVEHAAPPDTTDETQRRVTGVDTAAALAGRDTADPAAAPPGTPVLAAPALRGGGESTLARLVADALRWAADAQLALVPASVLAADLDAGAADGDIVRRVLPATGGLVRLHVSGAQLRTALEQALAVAPPAAGLSGAIVRYDADAPPGHRVLTVRLEDGTTLREDHLYTVAVPADVLAGGAGIPALARALAREEIPRAPAEALVDYLKTLPQPARPPHDARFRMAPATEGGGRPGPDPTSSLPGGL